MAKRKRKTDLIQWNVRVPRWVRDHFEDVGKQEGLTRNQVAVRLLTLFAGMDQTGQVMEDAVGSLFGQEVVDRIEETAERVFREIMAKQEVVRQAAAISAGGQAKGPVRRRSGKRVKK